MAESKAVRGTFVLYGDWTPDIMPDVHKPAGCDYYVIELGVDHRWHITADQLRHLREEITKALGESPQDISQLEEVASLLATVDSATSAISRILWPAVPTAHE